MSIFNDVKKMCGVSADYTAYDTDFYLYINAVFSTLQQLGVGPEEGFMIDDTTTEWVDFLGTDLRYNNVKTYMAMRVRMLFDPPETSFLISAMNEQILSLEWRINVHRENTYVVEPEVVPDEDI